MKLFLKLTMAVLIWLLISVSAYGQLATVYPGIGCKPFNAAANTVRTTETFIFNPSLTTPVTIVCPILHEISGHVSTLLTINVSGLVRGANPSLTCSAISQLLDSSATGTQPTQSFTKTVTSFSTSEPLELEIQLPTSEDTPRIFSLSCILPPQGRLFVYTVQESF
jgi:hypothetical protein